MRRLIALSMLVVSAAAASAQSPASDAAAATPLVEFEMMRTAALGRKMFEQRVDYAVRQIQQFIRP